MVYFIYGHCVTSMYHICCRDLATSHVDKDLIAVCYGGLENGEYIRHACLAKLDGQSPDETDVGTIETLGMFKTGGIVHRYVTIFYLSICPVVHVKTFIYISFS